MSKPLVETKTLRTEKLDIERKSVVVQLQENLRGRLLRITEECRGRRNTIVIPATGLAELHRVLGLMLEQSGTGSQTKPGPELP
jgi:hypothetical protein